MRAVGVERELFEPFEGEREVRAALGARDRVDLVDDHPADAAQRLRAPRGEHEVEGLRRRDEDVRGCARQPPPFVGGRVAGAQADGRLVELRAEPFGVAPDAGERRTEVALDVDRERLQRRDVQDAAALVRGRHGIGDQPVDGPEERGEGLPGSRGGQQQRVGAAGDRVPAELLDGCGRVEGAVEPGPDGR